MQPIEPPEPDGAPHVKHGAVECDFMSHPLGSRRRHQSGAWSCEAPRNAGALATLSARTLMHLSPIFSSFNQYGTRPHRAETSSGRSVFAEPPIDSV